jgi:hypothetical protein
MIGAADLDGFVVDACEVILRARSAEDPDLSRGTVDAERFELWVREKLLPVLGNYERGEKRSIVVMDNASTHTSTATLRHLIESKGAHLVFSAPYSPDLNPIERCFNQYKSALRANEVLAHTDYMAAHFKALGVVSRSNMENYYLKVVPNFEVYIRNKKLMRRLSLRQSIFQRVVVLNALRERARQGNHQGL